MKDTINYTMYGTNYELKFRRGKYQNNGNTAVQIVCKEEGSDFYEPFGVLTVNLDLLPKEVLAYINTNHIPEDLIEMLEEEDVIKFMGKARISGFVNYPLYSFNPDWLKSLDAIRF